MKTVLTRAELVRVGIEKEQRGGKNHGYGATHNGDGKHLINWVKTTDGRVWITSPRRGYRLAGNRKPPAGF